MGVLTIFLGGLNMLFEADVKKWIAFYKRGMFLCAGIILMGGFGSQDMRSVVKGGEGFVFFLCSLGVLLVPTFFSKHAVFSFLNEGRLPILGISSLTMVFLIWSTVRFF